VAQILTLVLLGVTDSFLLWDKVEWRGGIIADPYLGPFIILLSIGLAVWIFAIIWDLRLKMWREQMTVLTERNPYAKEKMSAKEIAIYQEFWLPLLEKFGREDAKLKRSADSLRTWLSKEVEKDPALARDVKELMEHIEKSE
jgi:hypothetical protein